jgi:predicted CoA-binding protein
MGRCRVIAVVGASKNPAKEAHSVPLYLKGAGYRLIPINPSAGEILGEKAYPSLLDLPESLAKQIDVVEVFRPSEELPEVARQVLELSKRHQTPLVFWSQLGLENEEAKETLTRGGVPYVMNECMRVVHASMAAGI